MFKPLRMNLQLFAEPEDPALIDPIEDDNDPVDEEAEQEQEQEVEEESDPEPEKETEEGEDEEKEEPKPKESKQEPDDNTPWVKKRLARAERSFERKFLDEATSLSDGVSVERTEIPKAVRLWNILKHNSELSGKVNAFINEAIEKGEAKDLKGISPVAQVDKLTAKMDLKEAELELRYSDPVFKKHEEAIREYAEDEGIDINSAKALRLAYKAWKGENAAVLMANAEQKSQQKAVQKAQTRKAATLASARTPVKGAQLDYRKASDKQILENLGLSLFTDE